MILRLFVIGYFGLLHIFCNGQGKLNDDELAREIIASTSAWIENGQRTVSNYRDRGLAYHQLDSLELARQDFTSALQIDPINADLYDLRANVNYDMGYYAESISDYDRAISLESGNLPYYIGRGVARAKLGDLQNADSDYSYVLDKDSTDELALFNRAILYWKTRDKKRSVLSDFARLLRNYPTAQYFYNRGEYYVEIEDYNLAIKDLERAIKLDRKNLTYQVEKAYCLGMLGRHSEAKNAFSACEKLDSQNPELYWRRGLWKLHEKKNSLACGDFRRAESLGLKLDELLFKCR